MTDLRKLSEAATPGEWRCEAGSGRPDLDVLFFNEQGSAYDEPFASMVGFTCREDAAFIVALANEFRSDSLIPRSEYEHLLALLAEARAAFDGCIEVMDEEADHRLEGWQETDAYVVAVTAPLASAREVRARIDDALAAGPEAKG